MRKLKVGIIGCGRISIMHLNAIALSEYATLTCCCDVIKEKADAVAETYGVKAYTDYQVMLRSEQLDAVHICLPHYLHSKVACFAFDMGINVISEKPMDVDYESAENAVKLAEQKGVLFGVIFQCRYNTASQLVKKAMQEGRLGKIISARSIVTWSRDEEYYLECDWKGSWEKEGGGVIINQAIHTIDLVNWIVDDEIESVFCTMSNRCHPRIEVEDVAEGFVKYKNGTTYSFYCTNNYGCDEPIEIKLFCEKANVIMGSDDVHIYYNDGKVEKAQQENNVIKCEGGKEYWGFQHETQIKQFYRAVLGLEQLEISGKEALKTHKLICELYDKGGLKK